MQFPHAMRIENNYTKREAKPMLPQQTTLPQSMEPSSGSGYILTNETAQNEGEKHASSTQANDAHLQCPNPSNPDL